MSAFQDGGVGGSLLGFATLRLLGQSQQAAEESKQHSGLLASSPAAVAAF